MADYKDLLQGFVSKAKKIATSEPVTDLVGKMKDVAESTGVKEVYEKGASRAKSFGTATKRTWELRDDYAERERIFAEIGKLFYEQCDKAPDALYAALFQQLKEVEAAMDKLFQNFKDGVPLGLLDQFMPIQYTKVRIGSLKNAPKELIMDRITNCIDEYLYGTRQEKLG